MPDTIADRFIDALDVLETRRNAEPLAALFSDHADIGNVIVPEKFHGRKGAVDFWTKYRNTFESLRSTFRNRVVQENRIALEWTTEGLSGGAQVKYDGVSILEVEGDKINRFRAYFDPAALGRQIEK